MNLREYIKSTIEELLNEDYSNVTLYHGTNNDFKEFDIDKSGMIQYSDWGKGIYFTSSKHMADQYRIDAVKKLNKEYNDAYDEYNQSEKNLKSAKRGTEEHNRLNDLTYVALKKFQEVAKKLNDTKEGRLVVAKIKPGAKIYRYNYEGMSDTSLSDRVKSKGYDIILVDEDGFTEEYVVLNPESIVITGEIKL